LERFIDKTAIEIKELKNEIREVNDLIGGKIDAVNDLIGGIGKSNGMFAEEFFFNTINNGDKKLFGEQFSECYSSSKKYVKENRTRTENDILLVNGKTVAFVEVKYRARKDDVEKIITKLPKIRATYSEYKSHGIYLGLAAMSFDDDVETTASNNGIAIIKQVGDKIIVKDEHVQMF
jgi:Holliday junction resolvase-like predicted endonuclease